MFMLPFPDNAHKGSDRPKSSSSAKKDFPARVSPPLTLEPAIEGPPSPQRIRAYTEQMKKSPAFSHNRTNTSSSTTPSFHSAASSAEMNDMVTTLSRQSSRKSTVGSSPKSERPDSIQIFGKSFFSRSSKKAKREITGRLRSSSSLSLYQKDSNTSAGRMTSRSNGSENGAEEPRKYSISGPYNFQHVTHTRQEQVSNLDVSRADRLLEDLASARNSNATHRELNGIRAEDLHFENFSSEALDTINESGQGRIRSRTSPNRPPSLLRNSQSPPLPRPQLRSSRSHDNIRGGVPPPRPPRSPMGQACPISLPPRVSSRTASMIWDDYDPLGMTSLERPYASSGIRRPQAFHLPISPPLPMSHEIPAEDYFSKAVVGTPRSPDGETWPFVAQPTPSETHLADVPEEEENIVSGRRSRMSTSSAEIRVTKSVPNLLSFRRASSRNEVDRPHTPSLGDVYPKVLVMSPRTLPAKPLSYDSWEDDIDYAYEHEVEADCDYEWGRSSLDVSDDAQYSDTTPPAMQHNIAAATTSIARRLSTQLDALRHEQSLLPPSPHDVPGLSPQSQTSIESATLRTPGLTRPTMHLRSPSHASSFKESYGFSLSPSLLIPSDFAAQMDQSSLYQSEDTHNFADFLPLQHHASIDKFDDSISAPESLTSYRSSTTSRAPSSIPTSSSMESIFLLSRAASVALAHRSVSSSGSLPDLISSSNHGRFEHELAQPGSGSVSLSESISASASGSILTLAREQPTSTPPPPTDLRFSVGPGKLDEGKMNEILGRMPEIGLDRVGGYVDEKTRELEMGEEKLLPPSPHLIEEGKVGMTASHGRKASVPLLSARGADNKSRGRARAVTLGSGGKGRGSYALFPTV